MVKTNPKSKNKETFPGFRVWNSLKDFERVTTYPDCKNGACQNKKTRWPRFKGSHNCLKRFSLDPLLCTDAASSMYKKRNVQTLTKIWNRSSGTFRLSMVIARRVKTLQRIQIYFRVKILAAYHNSFLLICSLWIGIFQHQTTPHIGWCWSGTKDVFH